MGWICIGATVMADGSDTGLATDFLGAYFCLLRLIAPGSQRHILFMDFVGQHGDYPVNCSREVVVSTADRRSASIFT